MNVAELRPHERAAVVPNMGTDEYNALVEDVAARGIVTPLDILADGTVLDGRHRLMVAVTLGLADVPVRVVEPPDPFVFMLLAALRRRDLTPSQKAMLGLELAEYRTAKAQARERQGARTDIRAALPRSDRPRDRAASLAGVSPRLVQDAITVTSKDKALAAEVLAGKTTLTAARRKITRRENRERAAATPLPTAHTEGQRYRCIVLDPPWDPSDEGDVDQMGRAQPTYSTMPIADVRALPVGDLSDPAGCHLYLWITNRSLPKGFALLEAWGFRYVTALTWCKPSIGVGNYFRNNTEHVLFGVRGSLQLLEQDQGTWFTAERGLRGHSSKPEALYDVVRRVSPAPRLEMFARHEREGFVVWGAEVAA